MAVSGSFYGPFFQSLVNKEVDWDTDAIKVMLTTSTYAPDTAAHRYKSSVTNEVTGTGYTAGGATLASVTVTYTTANSWGTSRANSTAYTVGTILRPATGNGYLYQVSTAGTSGSSIPTFPTVAGSTVTDGTATLTCIGRGALVLDAADATWASSTLTARYAVIYDSSPSTDASRPLIALIDFGGDVASNSGPFTITFDAQGIALLVVQ